ncbi:MAG: N-acetylmuramoyl-L-alanine amidase [Thermoanaerobaculales bacterium]|nr:N-acetylmuramoyl-L-alanine amidase [Thermoanaerobaculales bacterium]
MRRTVVFILVFAVASVVVCVAQGLPPTLEFRHQGLRIEADTLRDRVEMAPIMSLLGGEMTFSASAGVWALSLGENLIQIAPDRRLILVNGELVEAQDPPMTSPTGVAVTLAFLDRHILATFGFHLETFTGGYSIVPGVRFGDTVSIRPITADFGATTTLVLALSRAVSVSVEEIPEGGLAILFENASPQIDAPTPLRSRRVRSLTAGSGRLDVDLAIDVGLLSWNILTNPDRIVLEFGRVPPTPTPAPVRVVEYSGPAPIVIDPGHGGDDTGAIGAPGQMEKDLTLTIARRLTQALRARGYTVRLTRNSDIERALTDRTALANRLEARLFISLHANSSTISSVRGAETYYMSLDDRASDAAAQSTADLENRASGGSSATGSPLDLILWDMAQSEVLNESSRLALAVQGRLNALLNLRDRGVKQAPFVVLTGATMPAVLVEVGFLSNKAERDRLLSPDHQQRLADAIALGIGDFLGGS